MTSAGPMERLVVVDMGYAPDVAYPESFDEPPKDDEKDTPGESRPGDQTVKPVAKRPWWSIGQRFVEGIPFTKTKRH